MDILERKALIEKLNKIYEPISETLDELLELKSQAESNINEMEDYLTNMGYERDALQELILSEEEDLAKIILLNQTPLGAVSYTHLTLPTKA